MFKLTFLKLYESIRKLKNKKAKIIDVVLYEGTRLNFL